MIWRASQRSSSAPICRGVNQAPLSQYNATMNDIQTALDPNLCPVGADEHVWSSGTQPNWPAGFDADTVRPGFGGGRLSTYAIALEAWRRGLTVTLLDSALRLYEISDGARTIRFNHSRPQTLTSRGAVLKAKDKETAGQLMKSAGAPVPETLSFSPTQTPMETLAEFADKVGYPVVVKPTRGSLGQGVTTDIDDADQLCAVYERVKQMGSDTEQLLQRQHSGDDLRILIIGGEYVAAVKRVPANVVGDGSSTVGELIIAKNALRSMNPFLSKGLIRVDHEVHTWLGRQDISLDTVPHLDQSIRLRGIANASAGGDIVDITDKLPEHIRETAIRAAEAIPSLAIAGVDILYDAQKAPGEDHVVIEINARPHIGVNMYPTVGEGQDIPAFLISKFFPDSSPYSASKLGTVRFNLEANTRPLDMRTASRVDLQAMPVEGFPSRSLLEFSEIPNISVARKRAILASVDRHHISGWIHTSKGEMMLAGTKDRTSAARVEILGALRIGPIRTTQWHGIVEQGFILND